MDAKNLYDGIGRLLTVSPSRDLSKPVHNAEEKKSIPENGNLPVVENGVVADVEQTTGADADADADANEKEGADADVKEESPTLQTGERRHSDV
jgi:hypothetical protein